MPYGAPAAIQNDANTSGGHWEALLATDAGPYIDSTLTNVLAGTYDLAMLYKAHPNRGTITMSLDGNPIGGTLDQYSASPAYPALDLGAVTFGTYGDHVFRQTVVGKNPAAGAYTASADKFVLTLIQPPRPSFSAISSSANGSIQLGGSAYPTLQYEIQANDDLRTAYWTTIGTASVSANGSLVFSDTNASNRPSRFYRLQFP